MYPAIPKARAVKKVRERFDGAVPVLEDGEELALTLVWAVEVDAEDVAEDAACEY